MVPLDLDLLRREQCVAIARGQHTRHCAETARVLGSEGIRIIEFPLTTPGILEALPDIIDAVAGQASIGVGSVLTPEQAMEAVSVGAEFLVTPTVDLTVIRTAVEIRVPILVGALTPTEMYSAWTAGATAVKLFPASLGGPRLVRELLSGPFPSMPLVPTGGVSLGTGKSYLDAGAVALGLGGALLGDVLTTGDHVGLRERAAQVRALRTVRP